MTRESDRLFSLDGKRALVTGASRGIGRAIALGYAEAGADVFVTARSEDDIASLAGAIGDLGRRSGYAPIDLSDPSVAGTLVDRAREALGGLDILVNNSGLSITKPATQFSREEVRATLALNLETPFALCQLVSPVFVEQGGGKIVNVASVAAVVGYRFDAPYIASKSGLMGMTRAFAAELAHKNVQVNALVPGLVKTEMTRELFENDRSLQWTLDRTPVRRHAEPEEMVGPAIFLASQASSYMTGQMLVIDGGYTTV